MNEPSFYTPSPIKTVTKWAVVTKWYEVWKKYMWNNYHFNRKYGSENVGS